MKLTLEERDQQIARLQAVAATLAGFSVCQSMGADGNSGTADTAADTEWQHRYQALEESVVERNEVGMCHSRQKFLYLIYLLKMCALRHPKK